MGRSLHPLIQMLLITHEAEKQINTMMRRSLKRAIKRILGCDVVIIFVSGEGLSDRVDGLTPFCVVMRRITLRKSRSGA